MIFVKVGVKMAHGLWKKSLDCGDNRDHSCNVGVSVGVRGVVVTVNWGRNY